MAKRHDLDHFRRRLPGPLDNQSLEQILIGHLYKVCGESAQIFRQASLDHGIDGEIEFKDDDGAASGKKIYVQLKCGNSHLRTRKSDGSEIFDVTKKRHLEYWINQPVDVYLVIRQTNEMGGDGTTRWMNVTHYLRTRKDKKSLQIIFDGEEFDVEALLKVRDAFFSATSKRQATRNSGRRSGSTRKRTVT